MGDKAIVDAWNLHLLDFRDDIVDPIEISIHIRIKMCMVKHIFYIKDMSPSKSYNKYDMRCTFSFTDKETSENGFTNISLNVSKCKYYLRVAYWFTAYLRDVK